MDDADRWLVVRVEVLLPSGQRRSAERELRVDGAAAERQPLEVFAAGMVRDLAREVRYGLGVTD